jgi:DNA-binding response OmpR family regulator
VKNALFEPYAMKEIFIVEDDDGIRELIEFLLVSQQYSVKTFPTARAFNRTVPAEVPDLFLLDIMLPDGNGLDLCKELKKDGATSSVPVVLMSAHADISRMEGADDFIAKPFDVDELLQRIEKQLSDR